MATRPLKQEHAAQEPGFSMEDVKKLVQLVERTDVTHIEWEKGPEKVVIKRGNSVALPAPVTPPRSPRRCRRPPPPRPPPGRRPRRSPPTSRACS